jgi:hypothetical protein
METKSPAKILFTLFTIACLLLAAGCASKPAPPANADTALMAQVNQMVTLHGKFNLFGKIAPCVDRDGAPVFLIANGAFAWGSQYTDLQGKKVAVTGVLRFQHFERTIASDKIENKSDYFYMDVETAKLVAE